jgi:hypothetical protein
LPQVGITDADESSCLTTRKPTKDLLRGGWEQALSNRSEVAAENHRIARDQPIKADRHMFSGVDGIWGHLR